MSNVIYSDELLDAKVLSTPKFEGDGEVSLSKTKSGAVYVMKEVNNSSKLDPELQVYNHFLERSYDFLLPKHLDSDADDKGENKADSFLSDYCNGGNLAELLEYASLAGKRLPEHFVWHIILRFIEYCFALHVGRYEFTAFHPEHVLFVVSERKHEEDEIQFPYYARIVFCGLRTVEIEHEFRNTIKPPVSTPFGGLLKCDGKFTHAVKSFGRCLLEHWKSTPRKPGEPDLYSDFTIFWIHFIAGADGGPPRTVNLDFLVSILYPAITDTVMNTDTKLRPSPWLSAYFEGVSYGYPTESATLNRETLYIDMQTHNNVRTQETWDVSDVTVPGFTWPKLGEESMETSWKPQQISNAIRKYLSRVGATRSPPLELGKNVGDRRTIENMRSLLLDLVHESLARTIDLATWSAVHTNQLGWAINIVAGTDALYDQTEPHVCRHLLRALIWCQAILLDMSREELYLEHTKAVSKGILPEAYSQELLSYHTLAENLYHDFNGLIEHEFDYWFRFYREARATINLRDFIVQWSRAFDTRINIANRVTQYFQALKEDQELASRLRTELHLPLNLSFAQLQEDKITATGKEKLYLFSGEDGGMMYKLPRYRRQSSQGRELSEIDIDHLAAIRQGGHDSHNPVSPKTVNPRRSLTPYHGVGLNYTTQREDDGDNSVLPKPASPKPLRRSKWNKDNLRAYKALKRWNNRYAGEGDIYRLGGLELLRQGLKRKSQKLKDIRDIHKRLSIDNVEIWGKQSMTWDRAWNLLKQEIREQGMQPRRPIRNMSIDSDRLSTTSLPWRRDEEEPLSPEQ